MDRFLGRTLEDRYLIEELIGVGGMANVYKGFDRLEHRTVAIKMLREEYSQNDEFLRRFRDESRAIYSLNHPNIVKIYDVILDSHNPSIVMEYVEGVTVKDYIERKGVVSLRIAVALTLQLLRALQHAHDNGIVHRDIKPQNIMLPGDGSIKVMDFGIARFAMSQSRTITSRAIGSVHYTSPEQARGDAVIDHRSDIYSVGIILYEMLTGRLPFEGEDPVAVALKQIDQMPTPPSILNPNLPRGAEEIVLKAMAKHPDDRYQSANEMIGDIEDFAQNPGMTFGYRQRSPQEAAGEMTARTSGQSYGENSRMEQKATKHPMPAVQKDSTRGKPRKKGISALGVLFGITCAFVVGTLSFVGYMFYQNNPFEAVPEVQMPSLVGKQYEDVIKDKIYKNFTFELVEQEYSSKYEEGQIYEQYPTPGKQVKEGASVQLKVSNGTQTVTLPDFAGTEVTLALGKLQEMGLTGEQTLINSEDVTEGSVIHTEPGANETVPMGSSVMVYVSRGSGKEKVQVPDVLGQDYETAKEILTGKGLKVGTVTRKLSELPPGTVLTQSPNNPAPIVAGGSVALTIAADADTALPAEGGKSVSILCMLPVDIEQTVRLTVEQGSLEILNQMVSPSEKRVANINLSGDDGTVTVSVKLDNKLYRSYLVDFSGEKGTYTDVVDNSAEFKP